MKCPFCGVNSDRVVDSRESKDGASIRRRRQCLDCKRRFTSYEKIESQPFQVIKRDERREPFDRAKLMQGLRIASRKRPIPADELERIADDIESFVQETGGREISASVIGNRVMDELRALDEIAYIRFASVYRRFDDVDEFLEELRDLSSTGATAPEDR